MSPRRGGRGSTFPSARLQGSSGAGILAARLGRVPDELQGALRPRLRALGGRVADRARRDASWSRRIPGSIGVRVRFSGPRPGVLVAARRSIAPHARPLEGLTTRGATFRHPVMGDRDRWVSQPIRPFLFPAVEAEGGALADEASAAVDDVIRRAGFG